MLAEIDPKQKVSKADYKSVISGMEMRLGELQRQVQMLKFPVAIVFEGWDAAGKGTLINRLLLTMDPRGFKVFPINSPNEEERLRPFLWRFWVNLPGKGEIAIFDRSWYGRVVVERIKKIVKKNTWQRAYTEINSFEWTLVRDGTVIIKFFLHIDQKEQKKRFDRLLSNPATAWKVTKEDWQHHRQYDRYFQAYEEMFEKTDTALAPWTIVEAHDRKFSTLKMFQTVIEKIEENITEVEKNKAEKPGSIAKIEINRISKSANILSKVYLSLSMDRGIYEKTLKKYQQRLFELEHEVYIRRIPVIILYQGWDAAGKGGNIKRLVSGMDPRGYEVVAIAAPNDIEKSHHYLWRFWMKIPKAGHITIFDRSWYGRVLVERIEGFCTNAEWKRAYQEINEMESQLTDFGAVLVKFWLHIDSDEQLRRFEARQVMPHKQWKIGEEDWRNRDKWDQYEISVEDMIRKTSTTYAPWTIVEANSKLYARIKAIKTVIEEIEKKL